MECFRVWWLVVCVCGPGRVTGPSKGWGITSGYSAHPSHKATTGPTASACSLSAAASAPARPHAWLTPAPPLAGWLGGLTALPAGFGREREARAHGEGGLVRIDCAFVDALCFHTLDKSFFFFFFFFQIDLTSLCPFPRGQSLERKTSDFGSN